MKKLLVLVLTLCLCISTTASAESLLPSLSTPEPEAVVVDKAPDYSSSMAKVEPDDVQSYAEDGQVMTYENVDEQEFTDFGAYLQNMNFEVEATDVIGQTVEMKLSDGKFNIDMIYDADAQSLKVIYEEGVGLKDSRDRLRTDAREDEPTPSTNEGVCDHCSGLGTCPYCSGLGTCDHCFGEGTTMCETCFGSGSCPSCDGLGYLDNYSPLKGIQQIRCSRCSGTGQCTRCGGVGYPQCAYCNGTGACAYCKGTSVCQYCHGTGRK